MFSPRVIFAWGLYSLEDNVVGSRMRGNLYENTDDKTWPLRTSLHAEINQGTVTKGKALRQNDALGTPLCIRIKKVICRRHIDVIFFPHATFAKNPWAEICHSAARFECGQVQQHLTPSEGRKKGKHYVNMASVSHVVFQCIELCLERTDDKLT